MAKADNDYSASPIRGSLAPKNVKETEEYYDKWAKTYDDDCKTHSYNGPLYLGKVSEKYLKKDDLILCIGAGTGLDAVELQRLGFTNLHGHDGSKKMLDKAKESGLFKESFHQMLQPNVKTVFRNEFYDAQVCVGCFNPGHLNCDHLPALCQSLKKGGIFIIGTRERFTTPAPDFDYNYNLDALINNMAERDQVKLLDKIKFENYSETWPGIFYVFEKM